MSPQKSKNKNNISKPDELEAEANMSNLQNKRQSLSRSAKQQTESKDVDFKTLKKEMLQFFAKVVGLTEDGRFICDLFHELPRRKDYPDYYKAISSPICLDMIKSNIESDKYDDWSFLFEDFELLVGNAKEYNMPGSEVYEDADTIDKFCKSYPFYQKPNPKPKKKGSSEDNAEELAKQQQNLRASKRDRQSTLPSVSQDGDESSYPKAKKPTSTNKKSPKSVLELMTYISKNSDMDYPYDFYIPLPKDINQPFPTKLDGVPYNWTLLHCAAYNGHKGLVDHLISLGADKEGKDDYFGSTPLIWAAYNGQYDTCELLIENHAANTKAQNTYGQYPLDIAPDGNDPKWTRLFNSKKKPKSRKNELSSNKESRENSGTPQDTPKTKQSKDSDTFQSEDKNSNIPDFSSFSIEEPSATHFVAILTRNSNAMKTFLKEFLDFAEESGLRDIVKSLNELPSFVRPHILNPDLTNEDDVKLKSYLEIVRSPVDINMLMNLNRTIRNFDFLDFQINLIFENAIKSAQIIPEYSIDDISKLKDLYEKYRDKFRNSSPGKDIPSINDHRSVTDYISVSIRGVLYGLNDFVLIRDNDYINPIIIQIIKITKNGDKYYLYGPKFLNIGQINSSFPLPENTLSNSLFRVKSNIANSEDSLISLCFVDHVKNMNTIPINLPVPQNMVFYCSHRYSPDSKSPFLPIKDWRSSSSGDIVFNMAEGRKPAKAPVDSEFGQNSSIIQHNINNPSLMHNSNLQNLQSRKSSTPSKQPSISIPGQNPYLQQMQAQLNPFGISQVGQPEIPLQMNPLYNAQHGIFSHQAAMYQQPGVPIPPEMLNQQLPINPAFAANPQQSYKLYSNPAISSISTPTGLPYPLHQSSMSPQIPMSNLQTPQAVPQTLQTPLINPMGQQFLSSPSIPQAANQFMKPRNYIDPIAQQQQQFQLQQQMLQNRNLSQQEQLLQRQQLIQQQRFMEQQVRQQALQNPSMYQQHGAMPNQMSTTAALGLTQMSIPNTMNLAQPTPGFPQPNDPNMISAGSQDNSPYISQLPQPTNPSLSLKNTDNTPSPMMQNGILSPVPSPNLQLAELIKKNTRIDFISSIEIEALNLFWDLNIPVCGGNSHFTITVPNTNAQVMIKCNLTEPRLRQLIKFNAAIRSSTLPPLSSGSDKLSENDKDSICVSVPLKTGLNPIKCQATLPKLYHSNGQEINYETETDFDKYQWVWPQDQVTKFTIIINRLE